MRSKFYLYQAVATRSLSLDAFNRFVTISLSGQGQFVVMEEADTYIFPRWGIQGYQVPGRCGN